MLDKASKCFLKFLETQPDKQMMYFDDIEYPVELGSEEDLYALIRYLESRGLVEIIKNQNDFHLGVRLSHTGIHRSEFSRIAVKQYLINHWIAILALAASVVSVIISLQALSKTIATK